MKGEASVQVLVKAGVLLDCLAAEGEVSASRLAVLADEPRSSVYRLLASLRTLGMVEPGSARSSFRLGLRFLALADAVQGRFDERRAALPVMERIHEQTGETVFLCIRRGPEAVCIERLEGRRVQVFALRLGSALPLHLGAAPRTLLAWAGADYWREYTSTTTPLVPVTQHTITAPSELLADLEATLERGYVISDEDVTVGIAALGAPVFDFRGRICAALSIAGVRPAILGPGNEGLPSLLMQAARDVSAALGYDASGLGGPPGGGSGPP